MSASDRKSPAPEPPNGPESAPPSTEWPSSLSGPPDTGTGWPIPQPAEGSALSVVFGLIRTIRPHQWVKNVFVLAPVVFAKEIFDVVLLTRAAAAFFIFCLLAGAVYTINDLADVEADRLHPVKRHRPIASGRVGEGVARAFAGALVLISLVGGFFVAPLFALVAAAYFVLNLGYTTRLKHIAYVDVACISLGFVLRVLGGGFATRTEVSWYLFACTALLALFLGFGKRRHELTATKAGKQRAALEGYTKKGLDRALLVTSAATIGVYLTYTLDEHTRAFFRVDTLWPTTLFVVLGVLRFLFLVRNRPKAESPTQEMLSDGPMVAIVLLWIGVVLWIVYNLRPS